MRLGALRAQLDGALADLGSLLGDGPRQRVVVEDILREHPVGQGFGQAHQQVRIGRPDGDRLSKVLDRAGGVAHGVASPSLLDEKVHPPLLILKLLRLKPETPVTSHAPDDHPTQLSRVLTEPVQAVLHLLLDLPRRQRRPLREQLIFQVLVRVLLWFPGSPPEPLRELPDVPGEPAEGLDADVVRDRVGNVENKNRRELQQVKRRPEELPSQVPNLPNLRPKKPADPFGPERLWKVEAGPEPFVRELPPLLPPAALTRARGAPGLARALEDLLPERTPLRFLRRLQRIDIIAAHFHLLTRNLVKLSVRQVRVEPPGAAVPEPLTRREV
mmetsp:Transcript_6259/g.16912  ORF Transcript_6259/g.16912 Transcript_6259/m.16912 type:complete len:329 (-) Transcript_6259:334-1320(-)